MKDKYFNLIGLTILCLLFSIYCFVNSPNDKKSADYLLLVDAERLDMSVTNKLPMSDYAGKNLDFQTVDADVGDEIEFSLSSMSSSNVEYNIYLLEDGDSTISSEYVKVLLMNIDDVDYNVSNNTVPTFNELPVSAEMPGYKKIYSSSIAPGSIAKYVLRIWVADSYLLSTNKEVFKVKLVVKAI